jgi:hypothetical protein
MRSPNVRLYSNTAYLERKIRSSRRGPKLVASRTLNTYRQKLLDLQLENRQLGNELDTCRAQRLAHTSPKTVYITNIPQPKGILDPTTKTPNANTKGILHPTSNARSAKTKGILHPTSNARSANTKAILDPTSNARSANTKAILDPTTKTPNANTKGILDPTTNTRNANTKGILDPTTNTRNANTKGILDPTTNTPIVHPPSKNRSVSHKRSSPNLQDLLSWRPVWNVHGRPRLDSSWMHDYQNNPVGVLRTLDAISRPRPRKADSKNQNMFQSLLTSKSKPKGGRRTTKKTASKMRGRLLKPPPSRRSRSLYG